jgi:hypothetical protein
LQNIAKQYIYKEGVLSLYRLICRDLAFCECWNSRMFRCYFFVAPNSVISAQCRGRLGRLLKMASRR